VANFSKQADIITQNKQMSLNLTNLTPLFYSALLLFSTCGIILGFQISYSLGEPESGYKYYKNEMYGVEIQYPEDWQYKIVPRDIEISPETVFEVGFYSPFESKANSGASVFLSIDETKPSTTLEQYKDRVLKHLKESGKPDIKDIAVSKTTLSGEPAYRIEDTMNFGDHWEKSIDIDLVKNGKLYEVSAMGKPEEIDNYLNEIDIMFNSVKIG